MWVLLLLVIAILRVVMPPFVLLFPILITVINNFLDAVDCYIAFRAKFRHHQYHIYDKIMDYWWYIFILLYCVDEPIFPVIFILFIYRTAGQIISISLYKTKVLTIFPNILENYFIGFLITKLVPSLAFLYQGRIQIITLTIATLVALSREYVIHVKKLSGANYLFHLGLDWSQNEQPTSNRG